ncbi:MAG: MmgE/PrpD family protein [Actinobacteria bacterium]|jgi:2-methylcitrate dehydratase PrpD|nr:MAG: MmgE/PrpD family protein [Actinomycetota bacterium]
MNELSEVAKFVCGLDYDGLPAEVIESAKYPIIDCLGVAVAGLEDDCSRIAAEWVESMAGGEEATLFYAFKRSAAAWTALANGTAAHALDFDDVSFRMMGHPSVALVPAIVALGEVLSSPGKECLLSYVAGLEVAAKTGAALGGNSYMLGWHHTSTLGALGAAASCGKLLGLDEERMACALGISCSLANGLRCNFGTMTKPLHAGMAAMNGVMAAQLAARGFTSNPDALFGENGFARAFSDDADKAQELLDTLGEPYELLDPGLSFKPYPCCRGPQGAIDAALAAREEALATGSIGAAEIKGVECRVPAWLRSVLTYHEPRTGTEGKFSLEFCVTSALLEGGVGVGQFRDEVVTSPPIVETIAKFDWQDLEGDLTSPFASEVIVTLAGGRKAVGKAEKPLGEPGNPMSEEQIDAKYLECVGSIIDAEVAERTLAMLKGLDGLEDINTLVEAYRGQA